MITRQQITKALKSTTSNSIRIIIWSSEFHDIEKGIRKILDIIECHRNVYLKSNGQPTMILVDWLIHWNADQCHSFKIEEL